MKLNLKFLLVSIVPQQMTEEEAFLNVRELIQLVESYGGSVEDIVLQKRESTDKGMYIGKGKVEEVTELIKEKNIDVVVLNALVVPGQLYELTTIFQEVNLQIEVWDRIDLILKIFSKRAFAASALISVFCVRTDTFVTDCTNGILICNPSFKILFSTPLKLLNITPLSPAPTITTGNTEISTTIAITANPKYRKNFAGNLFEFIL